MKYSILAVLLVLQGCATYTVATVGSFLVTDKGLTDHAASSVTQHDCDVLKAVQFDRYYCERVRNAGDDYVRTGY